MTSSGNGRSSERLEAERPAMRRSTSSSSLLGIADAAVLGAVEASPSSTKCTVGLFCIGGSLSAPSLDSGPRRARRARRRAMASSSSSAMPARLAMLLPHGASGFPLNCGATDAPVGRARRATLPGLIACAMLPSPVDAPPYAIRARHQAPHESCVAHDGSDSPSSDSGNSDGSHLCQ